jgi:hypothetical protein
MRSTLIMATSISQATIQDLFDLNDCVEQIIEGLEDADEVPRDVWDALSILRERLDDLQYRTLMSPMFVSMAARADLVDMATSTTS